MAIKSKALKPLQLDVMALQMELEGFRGHDTVDRACDILERVSRALEASNPMLDYIQQNAFPNPNTNRFLLMPGTNQLTATELAESEKLKLRAAVPHAVIHTEPSRRIEQLQADVSVPAELTKDTGAMASILSSVARRIGDELFSKGLFNVEKIKMEPHTFTETWRLTLRAVKP